MIEPQGKTSYMEITATVLHIECLPGGFLVGANGPRSPYTKQIVVTPEELAAFVLAWAKGPA